MTAKIVCRLLDADNQLLGWTEHHAAVKGDGWLRADSPVVIPVERDGVPVCMSLHWCDVNCETQVPVPSVLVHAGQALAAYPSGSPLIQVGKPPVGLPAVTVGRPVLVSIPVGGFGASGIPAGSFA